jgi:hypothetical protein
MEAVEFVEKLPFPPCLWPFLTSFLSRVVILWDIGFMNMDLKIVDWTRKIDEAGINRRL